MLHLPPLFPVSTSLPLLSSFQDIFRRKTLDKTIQHFISTLQTLVNLPSQQPCAVAQNYYPHFSDGETEVRLNDLLSVTLGINVGTN